LIREDASQATTECSQGVPLSQEEFLAKTPQLGLQGLMEAGTGHAWKWGKLAPPTDGTYYFVVNHGGALVGGAYFSTFFPAPIMGHRPMSQRERVVRELMVSIGIRE